MLKVKRDDDFDDTLAEIDRARQGWKILASMTIIAMIVLVPVMFILAASLFVSRQMLAKERTASAKGVDEQQLPVRLADSGADQEGLPKPYALLGGLVSFELRKPRWKETTLDAPREYSLWERAHFDLASGSAWIEIQTREARGDAALELAEFGQELAGRLKNAQVSPVNGQGKMGMLKCLKITGEHTKFSYVFRATVLVRDGVAVQVHMECARGHESATLRDWQELLNTLQLESVAEHKNALVYPNEKRGVKKTDPALAVYLPRARQVVSHARQYQVLAFAPDGARILFTGAGGKGYVEELATHRRQPLGTEPIPHGQPIAWSKDGNRVALAAEEEILVVTIQPPRTVRLKGKAHHLAFGFSEDELLVCTREWEGWPPSALATNRVERVRIGDGRRRPFIEIPFALASHPAVAPDGSSLALVVNREVHRSDRTGAHLFLFDANGKEVRQLTSEKERILSVAWSGDSRSLYVVRQPEVEHSSVPTADLYRISAQTGAMVNLTNSGRIGRAWAAGRQLLLDINAWDVAPEQRGIFRIGADELEQATAPKAAPTVQPPAVQVRVISDKVKAALGPAPPRDCVPTPALLDKAAQAFADAVLETSARKLDFSAASLDSLQSLVWEHERSFGKDPALAFGFGAYYGETLRRAFGAEWKIKPTPFGEWAPALDPQTNALVAVVLPWSESYRQALHCEDVSVLSSETAVQLWRDQKLILVYPPAHAEEALAQATPPEYLEAKKLLADGKTVQALERLIGEVAKRPNNQALAQEVLSLCESARMPHLADKLAQNAVDKGSKLPNLLLRHADRLVKIDPAQALPFYIEALQVDYPSCESFIKLGKAYSALGKQPLAESCWRRAASLANPNQKKELCQLMGLAPPPGEPEDDE